MRREVGCVYDTNVPLCLEMNRAVKRLHALTSGFNNPVTNLKLEHG